MEHGEKLAEIIIEDIMKREGEKIEVKKIQKGQENGQEESDKKISTPTYTKTQADGQPTTFTVDSDMDIADFFDNLLNGGNWAMFGKKKIL